MDAPVQVLTEEVDSIAECPEMVVLEAVVVVEQVVEVV